MAVSCLGMSPQVGKSWDSLSQTPMSRNKERFAPPLDFTRCCFGSGRSTLDDVVATTGMTRLTYGHRFREIGAGLTYGIERFLEILVRTGIVIGDLAAVRSYLFQHPDMSSLVSFACQIASMRFTKDKQLALELYRDPEIEDQHLILYVRAEHYSLEILDEIDRVSAEFEADLAGRSGWFLLTTDFRPPVVRHGV